MFAIVALTFPYPEECIGRAGIQLSSSFNMLSISRKLYVYSSRVHALKCRGIRATREQVEFA